jgi:hypothetical protein
MNTTPESSDGGLPPIDDERVDRMESAVFAAIAQERSAQTAKSARRGRWWIGGAAAAAVIVVAAVAAPMIVPSVSGGGGSGSAVDEAASQPAVAPDAAGGADSGSTGFVGQEATRDGSSLSSAVAPQTDAVATDRAIITTGSATVVVDDVTDAARDVAQSAKDHGGYVESMSIGQSGQPMPVDPMSDTSYELYPAPDGAWITIRVPAEDLDAVVDDLSGLGEVTASSVNRQDVTQQTIDLQARIDSAQASVDRLIDLMAQASSVTDLLAAESALAERQASLESYQQQLEYFDDQVAMSSLTVTLVPVSEPVEADPAGFTDGFVAGWNGLVATLNGIVIALGFLIPWIVVAGVAALIVWGIVRFVKGRRRTRADAAARTSAEAPASASAAPAGSESKPADER